MSRWEVRREYEDAVVVKADGCHINHDGSVVFHKSVNVPNTKSQEGYLSPEEIASGVHEEVLPVRAFADFDEITLLEDGSGA